MPPTNRPSPRRKPKASKPVRPKNKPKKNPPVQTAGGGQTAQGYVDAIDDLKTRITTGQGQTPPVLDGTDATNYLNALTAIRNAMAAAYL